VNISARAAAAAWRHCRAILMMQVDRSYLCRRLADMMFCPVFVNRINDDIYYIQYTKLTSVSFCCKSYWFKTAGIKILSIEAFCHIFYQPAACHKRVKANFSA